MITMPLTTIYATTESGYLVDDPEIPGYFAVIANGNYLDDLITFEKARRIALSSKNLTECGKARFGL